MWGQTFCQKRKKSTLDTRARSREAERNTENEREKGGRLISHDGRVRVFSWSGVYSLTGMVEGAGG